MPRSCSGHLGMALREAFDVQLVDDACPATGVRGGRSSPQLNAVSTTWQRPRPAPILPRISLAYGSSRTFVGIEAVAVLRVVRPVDAGSRRAGPAARRAGSNARRSRCARAARRARISRRPLRIEQAQLDALGVLGEQREVDARAVPGGAEGIGPAAPERARRDDDAGGRFHVRSLIYANRCFLESRVEPGLQRVGPLLPHESSPGDSRCSHYFLSSGRVATRTSTL